MYMFPRLFGLHNVFDSSTDTQKTVQKLQDYTLREDEISTKFGANMPIKMPKRLRGEPRRLVQRLQVLHGRCSYAQLLRHYCPSKDDVGAHHGSHHGSSSQAIPPQAPSASAPRDRPYSTQVSRTHQDNARVLKSSAAIPQHLTLQSTNKLMDAKTLLDAATPASHVSAFCQAVLSKIIPDDFWGVGNVRTHNKTVIMKKVDRFVRLRQFETMSLHDVVQDFRVADIPWLSPPNLAGKRCSLPEARKRHEIFLEFLYYIFDSLLIPLVRSNFYVTESNVHRYRLLFFRHGVWKKIAEPAMAVIKASMFEEVKLPQAQVILASRRLGFSQIRLLPKASGVRPIMNLRRRQLVGRPGQQWLGPSINSVLSPVYAMLKLEKASLGRS